MAAGGANRATWRVGDATITKVVEIEIAGPATWILPDATPENLGGVPSTAVFRFENCRDVLGEVQPGLTAKFQ